MKLRLVKQNDGHHDANSLTTSQSIIGIVDLDPKFNSIEKPGLFALSVPTLAMARSIIVETIISNASNKTALLSFEDKSDVFNVPQNKADKLMAIYRTGHLSLNFIYVEEYNLFFKKIKSDISSKKFADFDLIVIDIYQDIFLSMTEMELAFLLSSWQSWFISQNMMCLWIIYGDQSSNVTHKQFSKFNNLFNGLTVIDYESINIKYNILFWHLKMSVQANISLDLIFDEDNHQLSIDKFSKTPSLVSLMSPLTGQETTLLLKPSSLSHELYPRKWELVNDFDEIFNIIGHDSIATIIIYTISSEHVSELAQQILHVRRKGGRQLKIIVREMNLPLRNSDEKLLINLGANIVIPKSVEFLKFISMVDAMQGCYYSRVIPNNIEEYNQIDINSYSKGAMSVDEFVEQINILIDYAQKMEINSSLIKFKLNEVIPIEEVFNLIRIKRNGDVFTHCNGFLYLFLYQCELAAIANALAHLFILPYEELFLEQEVFTYTDEIRFEIKSMISGNTESETYDDTDSVTNMEMPVKTPSVNVRNPAKPHNIF